jgi:hypothetical protein
MVSKLGKLSRRTEEGKLFDVFHTSQRPKQQHTRETNQVPHLGILYHPSSQISNKSLHPGLDGCVDLPFCHTYSNIPGILNTGSPTADEWTRDGR